MPRTHAPLALLLAATLSLTGCATTPKHLDKAGTGSPPPAAAPAPFASEDEALAAAVAAYADFRRVGDAIGQQGGQGADRLKEVASGSFLDQSVEGFDSWVAKGWRQVGSSTFRDASLQQFDQAARGSVVIYICDDISVVDVVDASGRSVVPDERPDTNYLQVTFALGADGVLRVSDSVRWDDRQC